VKTTWVLRYGGRVLSVRNADIPGGKPLAAILLCNVTNYGARRNRWGSVPTASVSLPKTNDRSSRLLPLNLELLATASGSGGHM
jgi:hypothetical protein